MESGAEASRVQQQQEEEEEATGYERTGGAANTSGQDYEVALCSLFLLRAVRLCEEFYLASNHKLAGKFDDVVLFYRLKGDEDFSGILLQAKHKAVVSDVPLSHKSSPFRLNEYLESFKKVRNMWEEPLNVDRRQITLKDAAIVLYTNTGCDIGESTCDVTDLEEVHRLKEFLNTGGRLLRIPEAERVGLAQGPDTSDFLGQVLVCTRQMNVRTADRFLEEELCSLLMLTSQDVVSTMTTELKSVVKAWWSEESRGRYLTADSEELSKVLEKQVRRLNGETSAIDLGFTAAALQEVDVAGRRMKTTWIPVRDTHQASVTRARLLRAQSKSLVLDATFLEAHWAEVEAVWGKSVCPTLALDLCSWTPQDRGSQLLQRLQVALQGDEARYLIVVATEEPPHAGWDVVAPQPTWSVLDSDTRGRLLSARVQLQGAAVVQLRDIVGSSEGDVMTDEVITSICASESTIRLGDALRAPLDYYVPRCLRRTSYKNISLESLENTNTLIFQNNYSYKSDDWFGSRVKILGLSDLNTIDKFEGLTLIRGKTLDSAIRNLCCKLRVQGIRGDVGSKGLTEEVTQFIPFTWICEDKVVLVEGVPGVGKSSFVAAMCSSAKAQFPEAWVLRVDMGKHCGYLEGASFRSRSDVIDFLLRDLRRLERRLLEHALTATGNVFLFLDAFDEISPDFTARCCDLVKVIAHDVRYRQMVVTTRPATTKDVQQALHAEAFTLPAFSEQEQNLFFSQYCVAREAKKFQSQITSLRRSVGSIIEVPLLCKMVAEVVLDRKDQSLLKYKDPWRRVLLYKVFVEQRVKNGVAEKFHLKVPNPGVRKLLESNKTQHLRNLQGLAVRNLMPVKKISKCCDSTEMPEEKLGLVVNTGDGVDFEHRTFAEFFLGRWLSDHWRQCPRQLLRDVLLRDGFQFVAATLSWSLLKGFHVHEAVARGDDEASVRKRRVPPAGITDRGGRTPLHVAAMTADCSREVCKLLVVSGENLDRQDELLRTTAVRYAEVAKNWVFIDIMQSYGTTLEGLNFLTEPDATKEVLIHAIKKNLDSLVKYILKKNKKLLHSTVYEERNTLLHVAAASNSTAVIELLLQMKHDVNVINMKGETPLHEASLRGSTVAVRLLLENGADKNIRNNIGETPLMNATIRGKLKVVRLLIRSGAEINTKDKYGSSVLTWAATLGHLEIVKLFVDSGCERNMKDGDGNSPLMNAAREGHLEVVKLLVGSGVETNIVNEKGDSASTLAARGGHLEVVRLLTEKENERCKQKRNGDTDTRLTDVGDNPEATKLITEGEVETNEINPNSDTTLMLAARKGDLQGVKTLIESGVDADITNEYGDTALTLAAWKGHVDVVKLLIESGVETNIRNNYGNTALMLAADEGHVDVVKLLIESGVEANIRDNNGDTALTRAAWRSHVDVVKLLTESGVETNVINEYGNTAFNLAAWAGHVDVVKLLIESGVERNIINEYGNTAFTLAAWKGHLEVVKLLIESGVETNIRNNYGNTALMLAADQGHVEVVKLLIESGVEVNIRDNTGDTALTRAAWRSHVDVVKLLIESGVDINIINEYGDTALFLAAWKGHVDVVKLLTESGVETNVKTNNGNTALMLAALNGHPDVVKLLMESGVETNVRNNNGNTALMLAAREGHTEVVKLLIESGVETNILNKYHDTAFTLAATKGHLDVVKLLIESGLGTSIMNVYDGAALSWAARKGHLEVVKLLIESGVETNLRNNNGNTALTLAAREGHLEVVKLLIESGVERKTRNNNGNTALTLAAREGHLEVVKLLIESGVETNKRNNNGNTALMMAAMGGHVDVVQLLMENGVETNIRNNNGNTALMMAARRGHLKVVTLLIEGGVETNIKNKDGCTALKMAAGEGHVDVVEVLIMNRGMRKEVERRGLWSRLRLVVCRSFRRGEALTVEEEYGEPSTTLSDNEIQV